tara:strand:+ start:2329 stop:3747 length:1419 start_codon:yes stop_codon:yes gene_type:complete
MAIYKNLEKFKNNIAIVLNENENVTYSRLLNDANLFASNIHDRSLIFILADNDLETITALIGNSFANSVAMLLSSNINSTSLIQLINLYKPDYIFLNKEFKIKLELYESVFKYYNYNLIKTKVIIKKEINDNLFLLQTTSGSTGSPKNVRLSYKNLQSNINSIIKDLNICESDVSITTLPPSYVYGLSIINTHLQVGAKIVLNKSSIIQKNFWHKLVFNKVNNFGGVPYIYEILLKIGLKKDFFKLLKYTTVAGGHLSNGAKLSIIDFYDKLDISLITMYGAAEATSRMSFLPSEYSRKKNGSIGIPITNGRFYLEKENKQIIKNCHVNGELIYQGENVCMGYANTMVDLQKKDINNSILKTGDIGYFDKDDFFYVVGKKNRYVKVFGNRISLDEMEKIIQGYGYKNICSQKTKDTITIHINEKNVEKPIKSYISKYTALHENIFKIVYLKSFPMTKNDKIDYNNEIFKYEN